MLAFENVLIAVEGADYYESLFKGQGDPSDAPVRQALERTLELFEHANSDLDTITWDASLDRLEQGNAAMTIAGDWARGNLEARGLVAGEDFAQVPMPGADGIFVMAVDSFAVPAAAPSVGGALHLLETFASKDAQISYNEHIGATPARNDIDPSTVDPDVQARLSSLETERVVLAVSALMPPAAHAVLQTALADFVETRNPEAVISALNDYYAGL
jgi:glucose/mannose transport system substrate-binding protein